MARVLTEDLVFHFQEIAPFLHSNNLNMGPYLKHLELLSTIASANHYVICFVVALVYSLIVSQFHSALIYRALSAPS